MTQIPWIQKLPWDIIEEIADAENVPANILAAIIQTESSNNRYAVRFEPGYKYLYQTKNNAQDGRITEATEIVLQMTSWGLTQVMGAVARELGLKGTMFQMLEPNTNILYCAKLLKRLAKKYTQKDDIIAAYNAGSPIKGLNGLYKNQQYVDKVNGYLADINASQKG
jgi:soluble lytic murein transglycosylase-like protein